MAYFSFKRITDILCLIQGRTYVQKVPKPISADTIFNRYGLIWKERYEENASISDFLYNIPALKFKRRIYLHENRYHLRDDEMTIINGCDLYDQIKVCNIFCDNNLSCIDPCGVFAWWCKSQDSFTNLSML